MAIEIRCDNIAGFNDQSKSYIVCNQKIRVQSDQVGERVICPKCKQPLNVQPKTTAAKAGDTNAAVLPSNSLENADVMEMDFQSAKKLAVEAPFKTKGRRCTECGGSYSNQGVCQTCGYVEPVQAAERRHKTKKKDRPAGFQLWLSSTATEGVSIGYIGLGMFILMVLFSLVVIAWGVLSTSVVGSLAAALSAFVLIFVCLVFQVTRTIAVDNNASLGVLAPFWEATLFLARLNDWEKYDPQLKGRKVIDLRKTPTNDEQLVSVTGLRECQVIDLENSDITDRGLLHLYPLTRLRCLVLKNTNVTREAVTKLQQHRPVLWIWM